MAQRDTRERTLTELELLQLQRLNTPTIYNGWEQITRHDVERDAFNIEELRTFSAVRRLNMRRLCCPAGAAPAR